MDFNSFIEREDNYIITVQRSCTASVLDMYLTVQSITNQI